MEPNRLRFDNPPWSSVRYLVTLMVVTGLLACSQTDQPEPGTGRPRESRDMVGLMAGLTPAGWRRLDEVREFTAENLYELINGRAELYLSYDVVGLTFASFEHGTDRTRFIDLSVYDMGTPTNAFGIFAAERSRDEPSVDLGRAGYRSGANCYVWKGRFYVQVIASDVTAELERICMDLARQVTDFLQDSGEPVWGLTALPHANRVAHSIQYSRVDAMGLDFMRNTYTAEYRYGDDVVTAFLSRHDSPESARDVVDRYTEYAEQYGRGVERVDTDGSELVLCDMRAFFDVVFQTGQLVAGVASAKDRTIALQAAADLRTRLGAE